MLDICLSGHAPTQTELYRNLIPTTRGTFTAEQVIHTCSNSRHKTLPLLRDGHGVFLSREIPFGF